MAQLRAAIEAGELEDWARSFFAARVRLDEP
jgi:hypothetical protein